jgi:hypothetical protein
MMMGVSETGRTGSRSVARSTPIHLFAIVLDNGPVLRNSRITKKKKCDLILS